MRNSLAAITSKLPMSTDILLTIEKPFLRKTPKFGVGDTVAVNVIVREGDKQRTQVFEGIVLSIRGSGTRRTFTVRKISSGIGVEKIFPLYSPNIAKIKVVKKGKVRRSKLYYMRDRVGKKALKVSEGGEIGDGIFAESDFEDEEEKKKTEGDPKPDAKAEKKEKADK